MAVVNVKSNGISNRDAVPAVLSNPILNRSNLEEAEGNVAVTNGNSIASIFRLCSVPSNARISQLLLSCGAITSAAADVGVYQKTALDGSAGAVVSAAFFGSAVSIATALSNSDITNESGTYDIDLQEMPLWQALGLSSDPGLMYDICATLTAAATATGKLGLKVRYGQ